MRILAEDGVIMNALRLLEDSGIVKLKKLQESYISTHFEVSLILQSFVEGMGVAIKLGKKFLLEGVIKRRDRDFDKVSGYLD